MSNLSWLEAIVIGGLQGVASLGHSILIPAVVGGSWATDLDVTSKESPYLAFVVGLHVALIIYFRRDWVRIVRGLVTSIVRREVADHDQRLAWMLVLATIPVGLAGLLLEKVFRTYLSNPIPTAAFLAVNGVLLLVGDRLRRRSDAQEPAREVLPVVPSGGHRRVAAPTAEEVADLRLATMPMGRAVLRPDRRAVPGHQPLGRDDGGRADEGPLPRRRGPLLVPAGHAGDPGGGPCCAECNVSGVRSCRNPAHVALERSRRSRWLRMRCTVSSGVSSTPPASKRIVCQPSAPERRSRRRSP